MKEKIERFFFKGWHFLACIWITVAFMGYAVIDGLMEGSWQHALIGFIIYLPWLLLFIEMYRNHKFRTKAATVVVLLNKLNDKMIADIERYEKLYGELPPEEPSEQEESEKQEKKDEDENKNE